MKDAASPSPTPLKLVTGGPDDRGQRTAPTRKTPEPVCFTRAELSVILNLYGQFVAAGEWRDYAIDTLSDAAVFSVFRRASEAPLYRIEKHPKLARRQGAWLVQAANGATLRRGHELKTVLRVFDKQRLRLAT
ncbi:MAG: DUF2794 domain-containing protein [Pseudomonadota bacterium]